MPRENKELRSPADHLPLSPQELQVLLAVCDDALHGYGIVKVTHEKAPGPVTLELGSLYRIISRMLSNGLIEEDTTRRSSDRRRKRYYRATKLGIRVAHAELDRLEGLLSSSLASKLRDA